MQFLSYLGGATLSLLEVLAFCWKIPGHQCQKSSVVGVGKASVTHLNDQLRSQCTEETHGGYEASFAKFTTLKFINFQALAWRLSQYGNFLERDAVLSQGFLTFGCSLAVESWIQTETSTKPFLPNAKSSIQSLTIAR